MGSDNTQTGKRGKRQGTEQRQKQRRVTFRLTEDEYTALAQLADGEGLTLGSYIRGRVLTKPQTRQIRRPPVAVQEVTRLQGEMNRIGGNIHQILKRVNFGETPAAEDFRQALTGYREVIAAILVTLGRGPR